MNKSDIYRVQLVGGLPSQIGEQTVHYRTVRLRETTVADEFAAVELAERVVSIKGKPTLLVSDELYRVAMTLRHVDRFECAGLDSIDQKLLTLEMFGRLSPLDLAKIEERCVLVDLAAQLRHGLITQADFDAILAGEKEQSGPRSEGQAGAMGDAGASAQSGPAMLADYSSGDAAVATGGMGR
ncbi:phage tail assembly protein [Burkholderia pseudomallei]|uniref:phage tail assembly protein n=1 Tax=pseudomallei group TaxID=111527 RepID=UPI000CAC5645|nr:MULTISPECIES: phage tail assembly protein [pseudomallei group]MCS6516264.1 phage tail assembly protein [Burkholderia thailandensis]MCW0048964.1 phage tail assembly protein [Burkholderia pseudomallei]PJO70150.1 hypothetical protein CWD92_22920 [Burkholderia thailandensis]